MSKTLLPWLPSWLTHNKQDLPLSLSNNSSREIYYLKWLRKINALQQILFKILEIKMNFWNPHTERGPFLKCSVRSCWRGFKTKLCCFRLPGMSSSVTFNISSEAQCCCWSALPWSVLVSIVSTIFHCSAPTQKRTTLLRRQVKRQAKQLRCRTIALSQKR